MRKSLPFVTVALLVSPLGAAPREQAPVKKAAEAPKPASPKPSRKKPPIFDTEINGFLELQQKADVCFQSNRRMFVVLGTNDCDLCRVVNSAIHERMFFDVFFKQFVPVFIDVSPGSKNRQLLANLKIDESKGLPVVAIFDDKNVFLEATQKGEMVATAKKGAEAVQGWILARLIKTDG